MEILTNERKLEIYSLALENMTERYNQRHYCSGLCSYLDHARNWDEQVYPYQELSYINDAPNLYEIKKQMPEGTDTTIWWDYNQEGMENRIKVLENAIKEVKQKIK